MNRVWIFDQVGHIHAVLQLWIGQRKQEDLYYRHAVWTILLQPRTDGTQDFTWICPSANGVSSSRYSWDRMLHQWYWYIFYKLEAASSYCGWGPPMPQGKRVHHKYAQVQIGHQGNRLVGILANSHGAKTLVKKGWRDSQDEASHERDWTTYVPGDDNILPRHVA